MIKPPHSVWLYTNRNCMVCDADGAQIPELQAAINCYDIDPRLALQITIDAQKFYLMKWCAWSHEITREEMQYLLGLRSRDMDLLSIERRNAGPL